MEKDVIVLVGAGKGGRAILQTLLNIQSIEIRLVVDADPSAPGILMAKEQGIPCSGDVTYSQIASNPDIDLILEVTGKEEVYQKLHKIKHPRTNLVGAPVTKIIFHLLESQFQMNKILEDYKDNLETLVFKRTKELENANKELEKRMNEYQILAENLQLINNEKTRYLLKATHQLKAPFAAIQSYVDVILGGYTGEISAQTEGILKKTRARCEFLTSNIKEMLELANLKSCIKENLKMETENLAKLLSKVIDSYRIIAQRKEIKIHYHTKLKEAPVSSNAGQLQMLLSVLLENAINYSHERGEVDVDLVKQDATYKITVKDHGIGISEKCRSRIFEEYFRSNEAAQHHEQGSGLGLSIAAEIAKILDLKIEIESQPGKGSVFSVSGFLAKKQPM